MNNLKTINDKEPAFLCTTALEDFWDTTKQLIFLTKGCLRYSRKSIWASLNSVVMDSPWTDQQRLREAYNYVMTLYERLLPIISASLNCIHNTKWNERYWRIVVGPWFHLYLHILYERYITLVNAIEKYPDLITIGLSDASFVNPVDTLEFVGLIHDDPYNLQLYTNLLIALEIDFSRKDLEFKPDYQSGLCIEKMDKPFFKYFLQIIYNYLLKIFSRSNSLVLKQSYFSRTLEFQLFLKTFGQISINKIGRINLPRLKLESYNRKRVTEGFTINNKFEDIVAKILPFDIPLSFIEGYSFIRQEVDKKYFFNPKAIFSVNSWYIDEGFKFWAAECSEKGVLLLGGQHGGVYGTNKYVPNEEHERKITDFYYTWGWTENNETHLLPFPATYLLRKKPIKSNIETDSILFTIIIEPRFSFQIPYTIDYLIKYFEWQSIFFSLINQELLKKIRIRLFNNDLGWDYVQKIKESYPDICLEYVHEQLFEQSLKKCRFFVADYLGTTYLEALVANKPTILFHDNQMIYNEWRSDAQYYYDRLQLGGILYTSPQTAADTINKYYDSAKEWWNEPERQAVRKLFCNRYARTSPNAVREWTEEFKRIVNL
jgi:putative transferase (TIGR04331 family)